MPTNWDTRYCQNEGHMITQTPCPSSKDGDTHHLIPRRSRTGPGNEMTCIFCKKTEKELREEAAP